jgi:hypothetical protein
MKYIYHHLGLGDHFTCNGIVRHYHETHGSITLFCYKHFEENIKFMYRDLKDFNTIGLSSDGEVDSYIYSNNLQNEVIRIGFDKLRAVKHLINTFDEGFYVSEKLPFSMRFEKYYVERNSVRENDLYNTLNPNNEPYIFVHEDPQRNMFIDRKRLRSDLKIITNDTKYLIFDYISLIERAIEVHVMQSSFKDMINSYKFDNVKFFLHNYVRSYDDYANTKGLNNFQILY